MKDPSTPNRMQKADTYSPACESSKINTPAKFTPRKRTSKKNSTPKKTPKKTGSVVASPGSAQKIDLRLEAKLSAELDAKVYAGRKIHPFFTLWKEENERRRRALSEAKRKGKGISGSSHVFENVQDDASPIDWSNWTFLDNTKVAYFGTESSDLSFMDGSVESLNLDNIPSALRLSSVSVTENVMSCPSQLSVQPDSSMLEISPPNSVVLKKAKCHLKSEDVKVDLGMEVNENTFSGHKDILDNLGIEPQCKFLQESMRSYYHSSEGNSSLWMHKYKPKKAFEVCGNEEAINFLRDWLHLWHKRLYQCRKSSSNKGQSKRQDNAADYASEDIHEGPLQSVLLITGPIGSGKSAAVYACAQEQGFHVLEINASSCRNGAAITAIKNKIEEPGAGKITSSFKPVKLLPAGDLPSGIAAKKMDEAIASSSIDEVHQTLILVEDVDIIFPEDRGFITAIQHFSTTAKWPIILTSNRNNGGLPKSFARLHVSFSSPLPDELLCHMYKVCITEEVNINPLLLKKFIQSCDGDIRKTIMQLQFWFQSKKYSEDREVPKVYGSLPFDLEACHQILPKILPWNYPSELSQLIEKEVAKSIATMDENSCLQGSVSKELDINERKKDLDVKCMNTDNLAAKVKRIKRSLTDCNEVESQHSAISEFSNCSGSPVTSSWQKGQSKLVVMCSSSEKYPNNAHSLDVHEVVYKRHSLESNSEYLYKFQTNQTHPSTSFCKPFSSVLKDSEKDRYKYVESAYDACLNETHKSFYASCFPGSISVPEAAIQNEMKPVSGPVSSCCHAGPVEVSLKNEQTTTFEKLPQNSDPFANTEIPESLTKAAVQNFRDGNTKTTTVSNVIDECSHADFTSNSKYFDSSPSVPMDMIQNLWRELRISQKDLGQHANSDQLNVIEVLKLTSGLTDLISEADLLFRNHQQKECGIMDPPMTLDDEATKSWYDEQMMMSTVAEHGFSFYAKHITDVGSKFGCENEVDLISEMLASTTNVMALGKLSRQDQTKSTSIYANNLFEMNDPTNDTKRTSFSNVIRSIIPARSSLSMKGLAFSEYMSSLRQISISEGFRISQGSENMRKRRRVAPHYLSKGRMKLTPEDISQLCKGDLYRKISSQYMAIMESKRE